MRKLMCFGVAVLGTMLFLACSNPAATPPAETLLVSASVGPQATTVSAGGITVTFGANAFATDTTFAIYTSTEMPFGDCAVSKTFVLKGLPASFNAPIIVNLTITGSASESTYIAVGQNAYVPSSNVSRSAYRVFPATVIGTAVVCTLSSTQGADTLLGKRLGSAENALNKSLTAVSKVTYLTTPNKHFHLEYPVAADRALIDNLGNYLEAAYDTLTKGLNFSVAARALWPVEVTVRPMEDKDYGSYYNQEYGDNFGFMEFNSSKLAESNEMRVTAGHEFFHLVQSLYDPRNAYFQAKASGPNLWLDDANSAWFETVFSAIQPYVSPVLLENALAPFEGIIAGIGDHGGPHGYGMSSLVKYIADTYGRDKLVQIYDSVKTGSHAIQAVIAAAGAQPEVWWPAFFVKYFAGTFFTVPTADILTKKVGTLNVRSVTDTFSQTTISSPDLSASTYLVQLNFAGIDTTAVLKISSVGLGLHPAILIFSLKNSVFTLVGQGADSIVSPRLAGLTEDKSHLLIVVANCGYTAPDYTKITPLTTTLRVVKPSGIDLSQFNYCQVMYYNIFCSDIYTANQNCSGGSSVAGSFTGNIFTGNKTTITGTDTETISITVSLDQFTQNVTGFSDDAQDRGANNYYHVSHLAGGTVARYPQAVASGFWYRALGADLCGRITYTDNLLTGHTCTDTTTLTIWFTKK
jgi:hypothetical protein